LQIGLKLHQLGISGDAEMMDEHAVTS
jgi:hypothetical protein